MLVGGEGGGGGGVKQVRNDRGRKELNSHLSSNYTTTLIPLGLELIARVQSQTQTLLPGPAGTAAPQQHRRRRRLLQPDNNSNQTWRSLSALEIRPRGLSKVHITLKAEQRGGRGTRGKAT